MRQGYVEAGVHGGMEEAFELLSREEYIAIMSNLVRIQGRIGTETAIRVGLEVLGDAKARPQGPCCGGLVRALRAEERCCQGASQYVLGGSTCCADALVIARQGHHHNCSLGSSSMRVPGLTVT